jgi:hypothetical protein
MMGRSSQDQGQLFYSFNLAAVVPDDHLVRGRSRSFMGSGRTGAALFSYWKTVD